ncbi:MAG: GNAT family N-acetyltransferase [Anaerolineales bacterium]
MAVPAVLSPRAAIEEDRSRLANLLHFETYVHRHLDWRRPLDWLGKSPYLVLESGGRITAALACPPDPPGVAWIRLFASATRFDPGEAWTTLWPRAVEQLRRSVRYVAAIPLQDWFRDLLTKSQFQHAHNVVVLEWLPDGDISSASLEGDLAIRQMGVADITGVFSVDRAAFAPLWQHSEEAVSRAFEQSGFATVIEENSRVVAFQISTRSSQGLHLARLATHPDHQSRGLAKALVRDVQRQALKRKDPLLSVNTQDNNRPSLALYEKLGFHLTGSQFPVFQYNLD